MNFTANLSSSLDDVDAMSSTSVQAAADRILQSASRVNKLSALLSTEVGRVVLTAVVQSKSHWRKISSELKESYRDDLLDQLLSDDRPVPTSVARHEALCESLLVLLRQDPLLILRQPIVERTRSFFQASSKDWNLERPIGYDLAAALRVVHTLSKHYEFVPADFFSGDERTPPPILLQLIEDVVTPVVKKCLLPVLQTLLQHQLSF